MTNQLDSLKTALSDRYTIEVNSLAEGWRRLEVVCRGLTSLGSTTRRKEVRPLGRFGWPSAPSQGATPNSNGSIAMTDAFGRQNESFETDLSIPVLGEVSFPGVFIRAPIIDRLDDGVEPVARLESGTVVAARQGKLLTTAFHPELTGDGRFHRYFLDIVEGKR